MRSHFRAGHGSCAEQQAALSFAKGIAMAPFGGDPFAGQDGDHRPDLIALELEPGDLTHFVELAAFPIYQPGDLQAERRKEPPLHFRRISDEPRMEIAVQRCLSQDPEATVARALAAGGSGPDPIREIPAFDLRVAFIVDPKGL
jgi:hypothetical protein